MAFWISREDTVFKAGLRKRKNGESPWRVSVPIPEGSGRLVKLVLDHFGQTGPSTDRYFQQNICTSLARFGF